MYDTDCPSEFVLADAVAAPICRSDRLAEQTECFVAAELKGNPVRLLVERPAGEQRREVRQFPSVILTLRNLTHSNTALPFGCGRPRHSGTDTSRRQQS